MAKIFNYGFLPQMLNSSSIVALAGNVLTLCAGVGTKVQKFGLSTKDEESKSLNHLQKPHLRKTCVIGSVFSYYKF